MKRTRKLLVMLVLTTALVLAIIIFMQNRINDAAHFVQPTGPLKMSAQTNINTFMEAQTSGCCWQGQLSLCKHSLWL